MNPSKPLSSKQQKTSQPSNTQPASTFGSSSTIQWQSVSTTAINPQPLNFGFGQIPVQTVGPFYQPPPNNTTTTATFIGATQPQVQNQPQPQSQLQNIFQ